jgi:hypothetical protein
MNSFQYPKGMNLIVAGGRNLKNYEWFREKMDDFLERNNVELIIHGNGHGTDQMADRYARERDIPREVYPAHWDAYGNKAGPMRNKRMARRGDWLLAFPGGRGTKDMKRKMGTKITEVQ